MNDLNFEKLSKKELVYCFIRAGGYVRTSDVIKYGSSIFSNRAQRDMFQLAADGRIVAMTEDEKQFRGFIGKENVWKIV